jgi:CheY-like chemotaxis protein
MASAKLMVVDDNKDFRTVMRMFLEREGYEVVESESGEQCLEKLKKGEKPDLILLDVMMPGIDGWDVSRIIKANKAFRDTLICMVTAKATTADALISLESAHANWHLNKPVSKETLLDTINYLLNQPEIQAVTFKA